MLRKGKDKEKQRGNNGINKGKERIQEGKHLFLYLS